MSNISCTPRGVYLRCVVFVVFLFLNVPGVDSGSGGGGAVIVDGIEVLWKFGMEDGGKTLRNKQCKEVVFGLDGSHNLGRFETATAFDECDFGNAVQLFGEQDGGSFTDTTKYQHTGFTYYGCEVSNHCTSGNMKIAVKTIPDYTDRKHKGFRCDGQPAMIKKWAGRKKLKKCRSMCNKMEGCVAFEYYFRRRRSRCKLYAASEVPIKGEANGRTACWIGRNDCNVGQISF
eukprot:CAMPEP_0178480606 /NCGR_PEP_ID=MMETSP0696-20121128/5785_1 /TAXON_ID=265572 /ORGANISM="Extubocellulus spinifer, Strain CCMP396" /LENGTH=230 /DNA_ID=CAMNT_0020108057 /DNA_START=95 /DNA_END=787 /DNA_ORIENTATION=-